MHLENSQELDKETSGKHQSGDASCPNPDEPSLASEQIPELLEGDCGQNLLCYCGETPSMSVDSESLDDEDCGEKRQYGNDLCRHQSKKVVGMIAMTMLLMMMEMTTTQKSEGYCQSGL